MTEPKNNPNKQRRSFFWQRKPILMPEPAKLVNPAEGSPRKTHPWHRPTLLKAAVVVLAVLAILPTRANGQFGIDTAAILAALSKMQSLMSTFIATLIKSPRFVGGWLILNIILVIKLPGCGCLKPPSIRKPWSFWLIVASNLPSWLPGK